MSYERLLRFTADPWSSTDQPDLRQIDRHQGSRHELVTRIWWTVIQATHRGRRGIDAVCSRLLDWVSNEAILHAAWDTLVAKEETAPGPNGHRYDDFDDSEVWGLLRTIGQAIRGGTYRVGEERIVHIPKDRTNPARGTRPISMIDIEDRVVQRAVFEILQRLLDPLFGRNVLGFRPRRSRFHALALAEETFVVENRKVFVAEDVKDAFTRVPINQLLDVLGNHVPADDFLHFLARLLGPERKHGIRQGSPLSPLLLNLYLHHFLDEPWRKTNADVPMIRVADDLLLLCRSWDEALQARAGLEQFLLPANMRLKGTRDSSIKDLREGGAVEWLGFEIRDGKQELQVKIAEKSWTRLGEYLALAHERPNGPLLAVATINGWINQLGPCHPHVDRASVYRRLAAIAMKQAFDEIPTRSAVTSRWRRAYEQWSDIRNQIKERPEVLNSAYAPTGAPGVASMSVQYEAPTLDRQGTNVEDMDTPNAVTAPWE